MKWLVTWDDGTDDHAEWFETDAAAKLRINEVIAMAHEEEQDTEKFQDWGITLMEVRGMVERTSDGGARLVMR